MGKCVTGWVEANYSDLRKSQAIKLEYCDHLNEYGEFLELDDQYDRYIAAGEGSELFINKFNYHGFRYIRISGLTNKSQLKSIKAYLIHTDYKIASGFECSDEDLNRIHDMLFYTLRCLSIGGDLVDCPQIERLGYGGDGNASTVTAQTMFNLAPLYYNWIQSWSDVIHDDGGLPHTAPSPYPAGGGPYWCGFVITATWNTFLNYGDTLLLKKYYPIMQAWLKKRDYPGYLFMLDNGATTTWEQWNGERSRIHNCYNGIGSWFYQALGGICPIKDIPAYRKVRIQPQIPNEITWANTYKETPFGKLAINWEKINDSIKITLKIPVGIEAEVILPKGINEYILEKEKHRIWQDFPNLLRLKSGKYSIEYSKN